MAALSGIFIGRTLSAAIGSGSERKYNEQINGAQVDDFTKPYVTTSVMKNLPQDVDPKDITLKLSLNITSTNENGRDSRELELGNVVLKQLQKNLEAHGFNNTSSTSSSTTSEKSAKLLVLNVEIVDLSEGKRSNRIFRGDTGFVNLGMNFILADPNKESRPIIKHGKIVYVDPLKDRSFEERCSKDSGKAAILGILPEIARILNSQSKKAVRF